MKKWCLYALTACFFAGQGFTTEDACCNQDPDLFQKDKKVFFANGEFLYWTVQEGSLSFAQKQNYDVSDFTYSWTTGENHRAKFDWDPGFRVSLGYFNAPKYWEILAQYTWLYSEGSDSVSAPASPLQLVATWPQVSPGVLQSAHSNIKLHYNLGDLLVDRVFIPNPHLRLRLIGGLVGTYIKQEWNVTYKTATTTTHMTNKWDFAGGGARLGLSVDWFLGRDFYLTGKATGAALLGKYRNDTIAVSDAIDEDGKVRDGHFPDWRGAYQLQFLLGPSYQKGFCWGRVELFAGYELTNWINLHELNHSTAMSHGVNEGFGNYTEVWTSSSMVTLHGLDVRLTINF